jgi:pyruvate kinase
MHKTKIICTLGPTSFNKPILKLLTREKVDIFRINLSHTNIEQIEERIEYLKKNKIKTLEQRDTKKLYEKAKKKLIKNLIGYNSKLRSEISKYKKISINTDTLNKTNSIKKIMKKVFDEKK